MASPLRKRLVTAALALLAADASARTPVCADAFGEPPAAEARQAVHDRITRDLYNGVVIEGAPFSANGNRNPLWKVKVKNHETGRVVEALFKPREWGDGLGWNRTPMEYVAYALNLKLGMDAIPPAAYRRQFRIHDRVFFEGALLYFVPDALIMNPDRHGGNFMRGRHWSDGSYRPILIDHAAALKGPPPALQDIGPFSDDGVKIVRRRTLDALKALTLDDLGKFSEFMSEEEMRDMLERRDGLVTALEKLTIAD